MLTTDLVWILRDRPGEGRLTNALEHMWGHVREHATSDDLTVARTSLSQLLASTQQLARQVREPFLLSSTALSELAMFVDDGGPKAGLKTRLYFIARRVFRPAIVTTPRRRGGSSDPPIPHDVACRRSSNVRMRRALVPRSPTPTRDLERTSMRALP